MFKLIYTYIKSLFIPTDITLTLNGSQLTFTKEGDVKLVASRNLITNGKYIFQNCSEEAISNKLNSTVITLSELPSYSHTDLTVENAFYVNDTYFEVNK